MTASDYRRLRRVLQRERQKGVLVFDQLFDLTARAAASAEPAPETEGVGRAAGGVVRGAGHRLRRFPGGPSR